MIVNGENENENGCDFAVMQALNLMTYAMPHSTGILKVPGCILMTFLY